MPRKRNRAKQLAENAKKARKFISVETPGPSEQEQEQVHDLNIEQMECKGSDTDTDATFDPKEELKSNPVLELEQFVEEWELSLDRDDRISLGLFLVYNLQYTLNFTATKACEYAAIMMGRSERSIRQWRTDYFENGEILENKQGHYQRTGLLWSNEKLNKKASEYVRENANVKGAPNLTSASFCSWINDFLLPNSCLEPGFPRKISVETARCWLHHLGFQVLSAKKGAYFDGHERDDVVKSRKQFLEDMISVGFLHPSQAPTPDSQRAFPSNVPLASEEARSKLVVIFHDESTFHANDDQTVQWGVKGEGMLRPKSKGSGIMVSDFIEERAGYLALTTEEFKTAKTKDKTIQQSARQLLEYGESREGYWTCDKFMKQLEGAMKIADVKYPKADGWNVVWIFDHSSCHTAMAVDALDVNQMNVKPGGKQAVMHDTFWEGQRQEMVDSSGIPKGMKLVLEERGICTDTLKADDMRKILQNHHDFQNEKPRIITFLESSGHTAFFLPKFHPELNPIERNWGQAKRYSRAHCNYSIVSLRKVIVPSLDFVTLDNMQKYFRKARDYMFAYFEGFKAGPALETKIKAYKSHRRIGKNS